MALRGAPWQAAGHLPMSHTGILTFLISSGFVTLSMNAWGISLMALATAVMFYAMAIAYARHMPHGTRQPCAKCGCLRPNAFTLGFCENCGHTPLKARA